MNFEFSEEEQMLHDLAARFAADRYDVERRRHYLAEPAGFSRENWALMAELGLVAAPLPVERGGLGLGASAVVALFLALGQGLVVEPLGEAVLLGARLFLAAAPEALAGPWAERLVSGTARLTFAHVERNGRGKADGVDMRAEPVKGGFALSGRKDCVLAAVGADAFLVTARLEGRVALFLVEAGAAGLSTTPWRLIDGSVAAVLQFDGVRIPHDHYLGDARGALDAVMPLADLARAAEAVGVMQRIFDETIEYLRTRSQFNTPIGRFQAIQHRMVGHYTALEQSKALLNLALVSEGKPDFARQVAGARAFISDVSIALGHDMIQFHGGMGVTDELGIGHGHKRLVLLSRWPDSPVAKLDRYASAA